MQETIYTIQFKQTIQRLDMAENAMCSLAFCNKCALYYLWNNNQWKRHRFGIAVFSSKTNASESELKQFESTIQMVMDF